MPAQVWSANTLGGYMYADNLSNELRHAVQGAAKFRQFCDLTEALGKNKGDTYHWNVYSKISTQGGTLTETNTMPQGNFTLSQGTGTVHERGNSVPYTGLLDNHSAQPIKKVIHRVLKDDVRNAMDNAAWTQFDQTPLRVVPTAGTATDSVVLTTNGTATATNNVAFGKDHNKAIVDLMKERKIPPYIQDDYYALAWPSTLRTLKNDLEAIHQYTETGFGLIMNGEIGRYENTRFVEQTQVAKGGAADSVTYDPVTETADAWDNAKSDWIYFMGDDTVVEGVTIFEELRGKLPDDYGRSKGLAWYAINGFSIVHTDPVQARIVKWDSAS